MRQLQLIKHGLAEDSLLLKEDVPIPVPAANEILVRVSAASVNPIDCRITEKYGWTIFAEVKGIELPIVPGRDFAGVVAGTGNGVTSLKAEDRVWGAIDPFSRKGFQNGAHSQYIVIQENALIKTPRDIADIEAASLPYVFLTTWNSLFRSARIAPESMNGKKVFINGGSGGVGSMAIQLLKALGAEVVASCSSKNADFAKALGADEVITYDKEHPPHSPDIDIVYNLVPDNASGQQALRTLKSAPLGKDEEKKVSAEQKKYLSELEKDKSGHGLEYYKDLIRRFDGSVSDITTGKPSYISILSPMMRLTGEKGFRNGMREFTKHLLTTKSEQLISRGSCFHYGFFAPCPEAMAVLNKLVEAGKIKPVISHCYGIDRFIHAFEQVRTGHTRGKVILDIQN